MKIWAEILIHTIETKPIWQCALWTKPTSFILLLYTQWSLVHLGLGISCTLSIGLWWRFGLFVELFTQFSMSIDKTHQKIQKKFKIWLLYFKNNGDITVRMWISIEKFKLSDATALSEVVSTIPLKARIISDEEIGDTENQFLNLMILIYRQVTVLWSLALWHWQTKKKTTNFHVYYH